MHFRLTRPQSVSRVFLRKGWWEEAPHPTAPRALLSPSSAHFPSRVSLLKDKIDNWGRVRRAASILPSHSPPSLEKEDGRSSFLRAKRYLYWPRISWYHDHLSSAVSLCMIWMFGLSTEVISKGNLTTGRDLTLAFWAFWALTKG